MIYNDDFLVSLLISELKLMIYSDQILVFENLWQLCFYLNSQDLKLTQLFFVIASFLRRVSKELIIMSKARKLVQLFRKKDQKFTSVTKI